MPSALGVPVRLQRIVSVVLRENMNQWGLARDEFTDTSHWLHNERSRERLLSDGWVAGAAVAARRPRRTAAP